MGICMKNDGKISGDTCDCGIGVLEHEDDMGDSSCTCFINAPCSKCHNESPLLCGECDWHEDD